MGKCIFAVCCLIYIAIITAVIIYVPWVAWVIGVVSICFVFIAFVSEFQTVDRGDKMEKKIRDCPECEAKIESVHPVNFCPNCGVERGIQPFEFFMEGDKLAAPTDDLDGMERGTAWLLHNLFPDSMIDRQHKARRNALWDKALKKLKKP